MSDDVDPSVPYLLGSLHQFTPGYGYGLRTPTARNFPTKPTAPKYRYPPISQEEQDLFRSVPLNTTGPMAERRNKEQNMMQTSGDYGRFYHEKQDEKVKRKFVKETDLILFENKAKRTIERKNPTNQIEDNKAVNAFASTSYYTDSAVVASYRKNDPIAELFPKKFNTSNNFSSVHTPLNATLSNHETNRLIMLKNKNLFECSKDWTNQLRNGSNNNSNNK